LKFTLVHLEKNHFQRERMYDTVQIMDRPNMNIHTITIYDSLIGFILEMLLDFDVRNDDG